MLRRPAAQVLQSPRPHGCPLAPERGDMQYEEAR
jgi:hypothetical protein